jgi:hypothetical protein
MLLRGILLLGAAAMLRADTIQVTQSEVDFSTGIVGSGQSTTEGAIYISDPFVYLQVSLPSGEMCHVGLSFCESDFSVEFSIDGVDSVDYTLTTDSEGGAALSGQIYQILPRVVPGVYDVQLWVSAFLTADSNSLNPPITSTITGQVIGTSGISNGIELVEAPEPASWSLCSVALFVWIWRKLKPVGGERSVTLTGPTSDLAARTFSGQQRNWPMVARQTRRIHRRRLTSQFYSSCKTSVSAN